MATAIYGKRNHFDSVALENQKQLSFFDSASDFATILQGAATIGANVTFTLPAADGTSGQLLATDGSGVLSFVSALTSMLNAHNVIVGNGSNVATDVDSSSVGDILADSTNGLTIKAGVITNSEVNASAAIAYSKLNLAASIVNADIATGAAIAYAKLALTGDIVNADINASAGIVYSKLTLTGGIVNADINASAAIAYSKLNLTGDVVNADIASAAAIAVSKLAALTVTRAVATDGSGFLVASTTTATELGYVSGVTSAIQTQLNTKAHGAATTWALADGTTKTYVHSLGSTDVLVQLYDLTDSSQIEVDEVVVTDLNTLTLTSSQAPGAAGWRIVVIRV